MNDFIRREDVVEALYQAIRTTLTGTFTDSMSLAIAMANNLPSVEIEKKKGKWTEDSDPGQIIGKHYSCSEYRTCFGTLKSNFCPNCGAKME